MVLTSDNSEPPVMTGKQPGFGARLFVPFAVCCFLLLLGACGGKQQVETKPISSFPSVELLESPEFFAANLFPPCQNLQNWTELAGSIQKSLSYAKSKPAAGIAVQREGLTIHWSDLVRTNERLLAILPMLDANPQLLLANFKWVRIAGGIDYSGYYEPTIKASRTASPAYPQAIYGLPKNLQRIRRHKPYYDRRTIEEKQVLAGKGLELAWAADPVDSFFLEIQGSGRLLFEDGTFAHVTYAGQNGHKYKSSGRIMREKGLLVRGDILEQREWFRNNPDRVREILNENPSYVFFQWSDKGSTGAIGHAVDGWVSLATDRKTIPLGAVVAYGVNIPDKELGTVPLRGIGLAQDVGGAIKRNRIDIFCGSDERASHVASLLDAKGPAWILLAH